MFVERNFAFNMTNNSESSGSIIFRAKKIYEVLKIINMMER
jgi:hypothetical protein